MEDILVLTTSYSPHTLRWPDTRQWTDQIHSSLLVTYTHSPGGHHTPPRALRVVLGSRVNRQGLGEAGFVETGGLGDPWFPRKDEGRQVRLKIRGAGAGLSDTGMTQGESISC